MLLSSQLRSVCIALVVSVSLIVGAATCAQDGNQQQSGSSQDDLIQRSTQHALQRQGHLLRYKLEKGETVRWRVEQIATTKTSIAGQAEESSVRTRSTTAWRVIDVDSLGNMTFENLIEDINLWQKIGENDAVSYDSINDKTVPDVFKLTAETIGKPLATITVDPLGRVVNRNNDASSNFGVGSIAVPLPEQAIKIGAQWSVPDQMTARHADGRFKQIKTRMLYTLREVNDNLATIGFRREVLTPIEDPKIRSQIMQHMNSGTILFDMARGRMSKQQVTWNEKVQGFEGSDSYLEYLGSYTKALSEGPQRTASGSDNSLRSELLIKPRDGKPVIRY